MSAYSYHIIIIILS